MTTTRAPGQARPLPLVEGEADHLAVVVGGDEQERPLLGRRDHVARHRSSRPSSVGFDS